MHTRSFSFISLSPAEISLCLVFGSVALITVARESSWLACLPCRRSTIEFLFFLVNIFERGRGMVSPPSATPGSSSAILGLFAVLVLGSFSVKNSVGLILFGWVLIINEKAEF